jgi:hypothetical protein
MQFEQLMGRYSRLRRELADACMAPSWNVRWIDRLADELAATEREIASRRPFDEQGGDGSLGFLPALMLAESS